MFSKNLSIALLKIMDQKNLSQESLAEICDLSPRFVGNIIRQKQSIGLDSFEKICSSLELDPNDLLLKDNDTKAIPVKSILYIDETLFFPICPNCKITIEREYQAYCDRCGCRLSWKNFSNAKIIYSKNTKSPDLSK